MNRKRELEKTVFVRKAEKEFLKNNVSFIRVCIFCDILPIMNKKKKKTLIPSSKIVRMILKFETNQTKWKSSERNSAFYDSRRIA